MNGLHVRKTYWEECAAPLLQEKFPKFYDRMAIGALGHGSEFLGFDDEVSRDHDWSPAFCIFLPEAEFNVIGREVFDCLCKLSKEYNGYMPIWGRGPNQGRMGVHTYSSWLQRQCFINSPPEELTDWLYIREVHLLWATNGAIWHDPLGDVTAIRQQLAYYPDPVWKKRLALLCHQLHQYGPYQITRFQRRNDPVTIAISMHRFLETALKMTHMLRRRYAPVYKWLYKSFLNIPDFSDTFRNEIILLASPRPTEDKMATVHRIVDAVMQELHQLFPELSQCNATLTGDDIYSGLNVGKAINDTIADPEFRERNFILQAGGMDG